MVKRKTRIKKKQTFKEIKEKQDFERDPPRCQNCKHRIKELTPVKGLGYQVNHCAIGKFSVRLYSICNCWLGYNNETLAD